ncbi:hypothetical protein ACHQM5_016646 [Ranunculus cassubicifolius]
MPALHLHHHHLCNSSSSPISFIFPLQPKPIPRCFHSKNPNFSSKFPQKIIHFPSKSPISNTHIRFCSLNEEISVTNVSEIQEQLELLGKPSPLPQNTNGVDSEEVIETPKPEKDEVLAPFLKFFSDRKDEESVVSEEKENQNLLNKEVTVEYYEPKPGDYVVGVVVSGNDHKLDVNIGADLLGTMLTKEVLPLYDKELEYLLCDFEKDAEEYMVRGKMGIVFDEESVSGESMPGRPVVDVGTVLFAEVLGRTLSGRPLLSTRRLFRRVAWHRVRQIKQLNEPIEVRITEWNTGGLLTRIEVGRKIFVHICRIEESTNDLILSEREAWDVMYLKEGTLLEGTVRKIFPYGAQVRIGDTNRSGLLHISNITRSRVSSVSDLLSLDEKVKVLVVKSAFPDKISLSIADLESEPGLFVSNREKVFTEAEEMAKKYRRKLPPISVTRKMKKALPIEEEVLPFDDEEKLYANWKWFKFVTDSGN